MPRALLDNRLRIHYQRVGRGPDMVMIHGLSGNLALWHFKIVPELMDEFRFLTYDQRGHGYSDTPPTGYTAGELAEDLRQLLDALEIERPYIVGHSYGADVGLYFALRHPERVRHLVAIEPTLPAMRSTSRPDWPGWEKWVRALEKAGCPVPPEHQRNLDYLSDLSWRLPKRWGPLKGFAQDERAVNRLSTLTTARQDTRHIGDLTLERVPAIRVPVLLICTENSAFLESHEYLSNHLPMVRSVLLPETEWRHFGPLEQPEVVAELIRDALKPVRRAEVA